MFHLGACIKPTNTRWLKQEAYGYPFTIDDRQRVMSCYEFQYFYKNIQCKQSTREIL